MNAHEEEHRRSESLEELMLGSPARYTRAELAQRAGVSLERSAELWSALGFAEPAPEEVVFTDGDVEALLVVTGMRGAGVFDGDVELALTRALGQGMSRVAEWQVDIARQFVTLAGGSAMSDEEQVALAASALVDSMERLQQFVWRRHLLAVTQRALGSPERASEIVCAVGFADVVGFTSLSRGLGPDQLAAFVEGFEAESTRIVVRHGGRVVKNIGDEVMFVADDAEAGAEIGIGLASRLRELDGRHDLRVGVAYGSVLRRFGDAYGSVVNLAARLCDIARPGTVLVDRELAEQIRFCDDYALRRLGRVSVKGFEHLQPWSLRRSDRQSARGARI